MPDTHQGTILKNITDKWIAKNKIMLTRAQLDTGPVQKQDCVTIADFSRKVGKNNPD